MHIKITGTGSYIPTEVIRNEDFINHLFLDPTGAKINYETPVIINKFQKITGIEERRYASNELNTSDIAFFSAKKEKIHTV